MKILVCGGRDFDDWHKIKEYIHLNFSGFARDSLTVITGGANGADFLARCVVKYMNEQAGWNLTYEEYPADWKKYGKPAGHIRNQQMLDEGKPDLVIAFKGGTGTADMVRRAKNAGVEVIEIT